MAGGGFNNGKYSPDCEKTRLWKISRWLKKDSFFWKDKSGGLEQDFLNGNGLKWQGNDLSGKD